MIITQYNVNNPVHLQESSDRWMLMMLFDFLNNIHADYSIPALVGMSVEEVKREVMEVYYNHKNPERIPVLTDIMMNVVENHTVGRGYAPRELYRRKHLEYLRDLRKLTLQTFGKHNRYDFPYWFNKRAADSLLVVPSTTMELLGYEVECAFLLERMSLFDRHAPVYDQKYVSYTGRGDDSSLPDETDFQYELICLRFSKDLIQNYEHELKKLASHKAQLIEYMPKHKGHVPYGLEYRYHLKDKDIRDLVYVIRQYPETINEAVLLNIEVNRILSEKNEYQMEM